jgi:hypothetical protein
MSLQKHMIPVQNLSIAANLNFTNFGYRSNNLQTATFDSQKPTNSTNSCIFYQKTLQNFAVSHEGKFRSRIGRKKHLQAAEGNEERRNRSEQPACATRNAQQTIKWFDGLEFFDAKADADSTRCWPDIKFWWSFEKLTVLQCLILWSVQK